MKTTGDEFTIGHGIRDERGEKLEPEEQPVRRTLTTTADVTGGTVVQEAGSPSMRASVSVDLDATEAATLLAESCQFCANWSQAEWRRDRTLLESTAVGRADLDRIRVQAIDLDPSSILDDSQRQSADPILDCMGKCMAISEIVNDGIYSHPLATCPSTLPNGSPLPHLFTPHRDARREVTRIRDRVLLTAAGKPIDR